MAPARPPLIPPTETLLREQMLTVMKGFPVTELMPEQRRYADLYNQEYFKVGLSTKPANRILAEAAITKLYMMAGMKRPWFEWGPSPRWGAARAASGVGFIEPPFADFLDNLQTKALARSLTLPFNYLPLDSICNSITKRLEIGYEDSLGGSLEALTIATARYAAEVLGMSYDAHDLKQLYLHDQVDRSCGWWWTYKEKCTCTDRPSLIKWTDDDRKIKFVRYRDGFEVEVTEESDA